MSVTISCLISPCDVLVIVAVIKYDAIPFSSSPSQVSVQYKPPYSFTRVQPNFIISIPCCVFYSASTAKQETKFLAGASVINTLHSTRDMIRTDSVRIKNSTGQCPGLIMYINRSVFYGLDTTGKFDYRQCKATKLDRQGKLGFTQCHCFETPQGNFWGGHVLKQQVGRWLVHTFIFSIQH